MLNRSPMSVSMRRIIVLAAALVFLSGLLILLDSRQKLDGPKDIVSATVTPLGEAFTRLGGGIRSSREGDSELRRELEAVKQERDELLKQNAELRAVVRDVEQLRKQLGFREAYPTLTTVSADVIARDPQSHEKFLVINKGSDDGLAVGMPVLSPEFLIGQVTEVEANRAKVRLVIDSSFQTGARLQSSEAEGIVYGRWQAGGRITMKHIPVDAQIVDGDLVVTSGKTEHVPEGLIIGKVMEISRDALQNETTLEVVPIVDFTDLSTVTVITGETQQESTP